MESLATQARNPRSSVRETARLRAAKDMVAAMDMHGFDDLESQALGVCKALRDLDTDDPEVMAGILLMACHVADEARL